MDIQLRLRYSQSLKPCGLQKLIPNQSSFCWIYLLLLIHFKSSDPPVHPLITEHHRDSTSFGLSRWPGEERNPEHINWSLGFLRDQFFDPSSSPHTLHHWVPSYKHMVSPTIAMLMTHSSISHFDLDHSTVSTRISGCLGGHLGMSERTSPTSSTWQRLSFLSSGSLQLYKIILPSI